jgi:hypothetical protein
MKGIDQIIVEVYSSFPLPPDQIVCTPDASTRFASLVNARRPENQRLDVERINKRLLNLRRKGQDKGGLPRRWRDFYGRDN